MVGGGGGGGGGVFDVVGAPSGLVSAVLRDGWVVTVLSELDDGRVLVARLELELDAAEDNEGGVVLLLVWVSVAGTVLYGTTGWEPVLSLPPMAPGAVFDWVTNWAMPPKAVASTTPLATSAR